MFQSEKRKDTFQYDSNIKATTSDPRTKYASFALQPGHNLSEIYRSYIKIQEVLSFVGGIAKFFLICAHVFTYFYNISVFEEILFDKFINLEFLNLALFNKHENANQPKRKSLKKEFSDKVLKKLPKQENPKSPQQIGEKNLDSDNPDVFNLNLKRNNTNKKETDKKIPKHINFHEKSNSLNYNDSKCVYESNAELKIEKSLENIQKIQDVPIKNSKLKISDKKKVDLLYVSKNINTTTFNKKDTSYLLNQLHKETFKDQIKKKLTFFNHFLNCLKSGKEDKRWLMKKVNLSIIKEFLGFEAYMKIIIDFFKLKSTVLEVEEEEE